MKSSNFSQLQHRFICDFYEALDCPRSLACYLLYKSKEHRQLVELEFSPLDYNDLGNARDSLAATKLLSKADFLDLKIDRKAVALKKFVEAEEMCLRTNKRITRSAFKTADTLPVISMTRVLIEEILGNFDPEEFVESCNFGPGATTAVKRRSATHPTKFDTECHITVDAYDFVAPWFNSAYPHWAVEFKLKGASKIVTVPKNAKTDRTIAIEPGMNLWFQKGVGKMLSKRLLRAGIDLSDQGINAQRSRIASKFNRLATVDFSSASDTISRNVVELLLPLRWYVVLDRLRSKFGKLDNNECYTFEKFSSMGNGFTFELESLLFFTIAKAVVRRLGLSEKGISVFGDDVILPAEAIDVYTSVCADLGFTVNVKKSYSSTYYRESCGAHYWNGIDIKPIFLKEPIRGISETIKIANSVRRLSRNRNSFGCDRRLYNCYHNLIRGFDKLPRISDGYGDSGLIENFDHPLVLCKPAKHQLEGVRVKVWVPQPCMIFYAHRGLWLSKLKANGDRSLQWWEHRFRPDLAGIGNETPLPLRTRLAKVSMLIPRWTELGPWI